MKLKGAENMEAQNRELEQALRMAFQQAGYAGGLPVTLSLAGDSLAVSLKDGAATVTAPDVNACARGCFLLADALLSGKTEFSVRQTRHFDSCGVMLDMSRNGVMTVDAIKRFINALACLGMNELLLYMEDVYEVPGYPYFGYLRGRYSQADLREMDAYAASLGVELVPCVQTLGHMEQFLQWQSSAACRDQPEILLIGAEETYDLIKAMLASLRSCFRTRRIHIGMDEAYGVGMGQYYRKNGPAPQGELMNRHLDRVAALCREAGFSPMIWSDMYFALHSPSHRYYDPDAPIPPQVAAGIPDVQLVYWDYYNDAGLIDRMLAAHDRLRPGTVYAGGLWVWSGFLPHVELNEKLMPPALQVCLKRGVRRVFATMWGDDGTETNAFLDISQLPIFSEACWLGEQTNRAHERALGERLSHLPWEAFSASGKFSIDADHVGERVSRAMVYGDLLYPLADPYNRAPFLLPRLREGMAALEKYAGLPEADYAVAVMRLAADKITVSQAIRAAYEAKDLATLQKLAEIDIPGLVCDVQNLKRLHQILWERDYRRNGWEVLSMRYGGQESRLADVRDALLRFCRGELASICELDEPVLCTARMAWRYPSFVSPMKYI